VFFPAHKLGDKIEQGTDRYEGEGHHDDQCNTDVCCCIHPEGGITIMCENSVVWVRTQQ